MSFIREFLAFLRVRKKYWMLPILIMMAVFGGLIVLTKGTAIAPFIYTLFQVGGCASWGFLLSITTALPPW